MTDCDCDDDMTEDGHGRACPNSITVRLAEEYARGVADERARVIADLRARAKAQKSWTGESTVAAVLRAEADRIERGEHEESK